MIIKTEISRNKDTNMFLRTMELSNTIISFNWLKVSMKKETSGKGGQGNAFFIFIKFFVQVFLKKFMYM